MNPWIPYSYIAGFFDGEGSAMILTIRREAKYGTVFRFRPVIKIAQKKRPSILSEIRNFLGFGYVSPVKGGRTPSLIINGLENVLRFIELVRPHIRIKGRALDLVAELARFQAGKPNNEPYTVGDMKYMLELRRKAHEFNTRGAPLKYSDQQILAVLEKDYVKDIDLWKRRRAVSSAKAMNCARRERGDQRRKAWLKDVIQCECGCGAIFPRRDHRGRIRRFVSGHNQRGKHWRWERRE